MEVAQSLGALLEGCTWPHNSFDKLGLILRGFTEMKVHLFALAKYSQGEGGRQNDNLLTTPTNDRVVADARIFTTLGIVRVRLIVSPMRSMRPWILIL